MMDEYKSTYTHYPVPTDSDKNETQGMTSGGCKVHVFFATENRKVDMFPCIIEQLVSSFQNVPNSAK
jgi:hypothetical protein